MSAVGLIFILGFLVFIAFILLDTEKKKNKKKLREISENPEEYLEELKQKKRELKEEISECRSKIYEWESILAGTNKEWKKASRTEKYTPTFSLKKKNRNINGWEKKLPKGQLFDGKDRLFVTRRWLEWEIRGAKDRIKDLEKK